MARSVIQLIAVALIIVNTTHATASVGTFAIRETAELVMKKFGREAAGQGMNLLSKRIGAFATRFGDNGLLAFRKIGPRVSQLADDAGEHADLAVRLLAGQGDSAVRLVSQPRQLGLVARLGDDAAETLVKHGDIAEPLLEAGGKAAVKVLEQVTPQNCRRVAMMLADGELTRLGRSQEILEVIGRYGDRAAEFIWRHKGALAVGTGLAAFLSSPEAFIDGGTDLTSIVADAAIKPVVAAAAQSTPWFAIASVLGILCGLAGGATIWKWRQRISLASLLGHRPISSKPPEPSHKELNHVMDDAT